MSLPEVVSADDIAAVFGIPKSTLRTWVRAGLVRKLGRDQYVAADLAAPVAAWKPHPKKSGEKHSV